MCKLFQDLCSRTLNVSDLDRLDNWIVLILCKLERIYPPAFFDVMVHLVVHLPREAKIVGPVDYIESNILMCLKSLMKCVF